MCGIIGYLGPQEAMPIILDGLKRLEYRGYDSAGMAVIGDHGLAIRRSLGKLKELENLLLQDPLSRPGGHRPHPLGHPRAALRDQCPSPPGRRHRGGAQRHHRELPGTQGRIDQGRPPLCLGDGHGNRLPPHRQTPGAGCALSECGAADDQGNQGVIRPGDHQRRGAPHAGGGPQGKPPDPGAG